MDKHQRRENWLRLLHEDSSATDRQELLGDGSLDEFREDDFVDRLLGAHFEEQDEDSFVAQFAARLEESVTDELVEEPEDQSVTTIYPVADHPIDAPPIQAPVSVTPPVASQEPVTLARPGIFAGTAAYVVMTACLVIAVIVVAWTRQPSQSGEPLTAQGTDKTPKSLPSDTIRISRARWLPDLPKKTPPC